MNKKVRALIYEKDKLRGLVPTRRFGNRDKVYEAYLKAINPRENEDLQVALAKSTDVRYKEFLDRLLTHKYRKVGLPIIAKACGIDLAEFSKWWNTQSVQTAIGLAQNGTIALTKDMIQDAASVETVCERCDGMTFVTAPPGLPEDTPGYRFMQSGGEIVWIRDCPVCVKGKIRKPGDTHARDKLLEMTGLVKKGAGVNINIGEFGGVGHTSAISQLDEAMSIDVTSE